LPRRAAPLLSAIRRASCSLPRCGGHAASAWTCTPTCLRVASGSPRMGREQPHAAGVRRAVKIITNRRGGWNGRAWRPFPRDIDKRGVRRVKQRKRAGESAHPAAGLGGRGL
jgi:hypothetical protein